MRNAIRTVLTKVYTASTVHFVMVAFDGQAIPCLKEVGRKTYRYKENSERTLLGKVKSSFILVRHR